MEKLKETLKQLVLNDPSVVFSGNTFCESLYILLNGVKPLHDWVTFKTNKKVIDIENEIKTIIENNKFEIVYMYHGTNMIRIPDREKEIIKSVLYLKKNNNYSIIKIRDDEFSFFYLETNKDEMILFNAILEYLKTINEEIFEYKLSYLCKNNVGFYLDNLDVNKTDNFNIGKYYNDDFAKIDEIINDALSKNNKKSGLIILHGLQGTGKTTYIRNLINNIQKNFVYLPSEMVSYLTKPEFISYMRENLKDYVIILEDCENLLKDRQNNSFFNEGLVNILNIADGLIGDGLNIKFICTFNNEYSSIDKALTRKGRMICQYEFKELCLEKTNNLLKELYGEDIKSDKPLSLADIFNYNTENIFKKEKKKIGF